jgi:hypothetical protein
MSKESRAVDDEADAAVAFWLARSSITFLECALHLMLTHMTKADVIEVVQAELQMLEELD